MENKVEKLASKWIAEKPEKADIKSVYYCETRDVFSARLNKMLDDLLENKKIEEEKVYIISAIAGEIGNNSFDHNLGNWPDVMGIFFGYDFIGGKFTMAMADRGQGVLKTLKRVKPELQNDADALKIAFSQKISGRAPEKRGNGLKFVKENIENRKMHLVFISGNAQANLNQEMKIKEIDKNIKGCLAILTI